MGSVVGEKITCLIEYATNNFLPFYYSVCYARRKFELDANG
ncbi:hypothetical protein Goshw_023024 [Gossypium schwendimanii]|uniref:Uncharacterized protein n=1 Tax=Gossypium schwendimanii TaxID=34291 RepID=A0A7J9MV28_GOSSC|nr:hypothetical protein [Gossypium schwendimanii]